MRPDDVCLDASGRWPGRVPFMSPYSRSLGGRAGFGNRSRKRSRELAGRLGRQEVPDPLEELLRGRVRAALLGHELAQTHAELLALQARAAAREVTLDLRVLRRPELPVEIELDLAQHLVTILH